jgi:hypothetical protein
MTPSARWRTLPRNAQRQELVSAGPRSSGIRAAQYPPGSSAEPPDPHRLERDGSSGPGTPARLRSRPSPGQTLPISLLCVCVLRIPLLPGRGPSNRAWQVPAHPHPPVDPGHQRDRSGYSLLGGKGVVPATLSDRQCKPVAHSPDRPPCLTACVLRCGILRPLAR